MLVALLASLPGAALADDVALRWTRGDGADACWDQREVEAAVREQLGRDPFVATAERVLEAHVAPSAEGMELVILERSRTGAPAARRALVAPSCDELGSAAALAIAVVIDPRGALAPPAVVPTAEPAPEPETVAPPEPEPLETHAAEPAGAPIELFVAAGVRFTGLPSVAPSVGLGFGWRPTNLLALRVSVGFSPDAETSEVGAGATDLEVSGCASRRRGLVLGACAAVGVSFVHVYPRGLEPVDPGLRAHARLGASALLGFERGGFFAELVPAVVWLPPRTDYRVEGSGRVLWSSPHVEIGLQLRVGGYLGD
ncbi:MAG: hypothetical protein H6721_31450 [Sandaracinus sp.]|nr:hypothetical protein [Sandaracinus sp.]